MQYLTVSSGNTPMVKSYIQIHVYFIDKTYCEGAEKECDSE